MMDEKIFRLDDQPAMVVGAGSGIGRAIAMAFGAAGRDCCSGLVFGE
jgi:7-alpha-hydroxysteroid dehydrogenase